MTDPQAETYRELYDRAPCGLLSVDADGFVIGANQTFLGWVSRGPDEVIGAPFVDLLPAADQIFLETRFMPVLRLKGEVREIALSMKGRAGPLPVLLNAHLDGSDIRIAVFEATERQGYERALLSAQRAAEESESRVRTLQQAATAFGGSDSEQELAELLVSSSREAMAATSCAVMFVDDDGATTVLAGVHPLQALAADPAASGDVEALRTAGVVVIGSTAEARAMYPSLVDGMIDARVEGFSIVPIEGPERILGALMCFFGRARSLSAEDVELQLALARQAAQVLVRVRLQNELLALALHDQLTGLANRRLLREHLLHGMAAARGHRRPIAMLMLDLDGFKSVNDELGHRQGDVVLRWVADRLLASVRVDDIVGRFGGDEFIVICQDADSAVALGVAERIRAEIAGYPDGLPNGSPLSVSVGVAICPPERADERPETFFEIADAALYRSKREGKNRVSVDSL